MNSIIKLTVPFIVTLSLHWYASNRPNIADIFAADVFRDKELKEKLTSSVYQSFKNSLTKGQLLDTNVADQVCPSLYL